MRIFEYTSEQTEFLAQRDRKLGAFMSQKGFIAREIYDDFFSGLCFSIVNQQLSMKACETLWNKLCAALGEITPESCRDAAQLKACGLSQSKSDCIAAVSEKFLSGEISEEKLRIMSDDEVKAALTAIKGIGGWTAEMALIFCLGRENVLSLADFGIRKGLSLLHGIDMKDIKEMKKYAQLYSPYGTVASFYLWEAARELEDNRNA